MRTENILERNDQDLKAMSDQIADMKMQVVAMHNQEALHNADRQALTQTLRRSVALANCCCLAVTKFVCLRDALFVCRCFKSVASRWFMFGSKCLFTDTFSKASICLHGKNDRRRNVISTYI